MLLPCVFILVWCSVESLIRRGYQIKTISLSNQVKGMTEHHEDGVTWDPNVGVWVGSRAPAFHKEDFPDPLYIFGYGSLIWRPGELLEPLPSFHCVARGYRRIFAQRSCDHRGTVEFPGVVLNLIQEELLDSMGYVLNKREDSGCQGLVWLVPQDKVQAVIEDLDFREKGGYSRHFVSVKLNDATPYHERGSVVQALVYTGRENNPNFYLPRRAASAGEKALIENTDPFGLRGMNSVVDLISASMGPSGPNTEYLFRLVSFLEDRLIVDDYLRSLSIAVQLRVGLARYRHMMPLKKGEQVRGITSKSRNVIGWGSNEFKQLSKSLGFDLVHHPSHLFPGDLDLFELDWHEAPHHCLFAGGASTAYLNAVSGVARIWGKACDQLLAQFLQGHKDGDGDDCREHGILIEGVAAVSLGQDRSLLLLTSGFVLSLGHDEDLALDLDFVLRPDTVELRPFTENNSTSYKFFHKVSTDNHVHEVDDGDLHRFKAPSHKIAKLSVGLHHSVALTSDGAIFIWDDRKYFPYLCAWRPESGAKVIDIASGARHAVLVDDQGAVYTVGSNKHGSLGRSDLVEGSRQLIDHSIRKVALPEDVRFQRVGAHNKYKFSILQHIKLIVFIYDRHHADGLTP